MQPNGACLSFRLGNCIIKRINSTQQAPLKAALRGYKEGMHEKYATQIFPGSEQQQQTPQQGELCFGNAHQPTHEADVPELRDTPANLAQSSASNEYPKIVSCDRRGDAQNRLLPPMNQD